MSIGFSFSVAMRLWNILELLLAGKSRTEIIRKLSLSERAFTSCITKLKACGIKLKYSRLSETYSVGNWTAKQSFPFRFSSEEFFYVYYVLSIVGDRKTAAKLGIAIADDSEPVYDCGPAYGIGNGITAELAPLLDELKNGIVKGRKLVFLYSGLKKDEKIRVVHPYKLIHSPISWYLVGYCEEKRDFRKFKLARMDKVKLLDDKFKRRKDFCLEKIIGDAWWVQNDPGQEPFDVKVLFKNEAAKSIYEYNFHASQKLEKTPDGTIASWKLSYLGEFASWLMQWLGEIEIIGPPELKKIVGGKIAKHGK